MTCLLVSELGQFSWVFEDLDVLISHVGSELGDQSGASPDVVSR